MARRKGARCAVVLLVLVVLSTFLVSLIVPASVRASFSESESVLLSDDFAHDTSLNATLWQVSGPVGTAFASANCPSCTLVPLDPSFSSAGMEIAQVNESYEVGTIQSTGAFAPPFTVNITVKGTVSNGHPFVFGISSQDATAGVQITGNLNPDDCSSEANCGNPATCGTPANSSIPPNQCYYGIYARYGSGSGSWTKSPVLDATPGVDVVYALQVSVDSSGGSQFSVSTGGQVLGSSSAQVGVGPFYLMIGQSEGAPVPGHGPNQAYWLSVLVTPTATSSSPPPSGSSNSGLSSYEWTIIVLVVVALMIVVVLAAYRRRRVLGVTVMESGSLFPVSGAGVSAQGPDRLSGSTGTNGRVVFGGVKAGDYAVSAGAPGYAASPPVTITVRRTTEHTVRLERAVPIARDSGVPQAPPEMRGREPPATTVGTAAPTPRAPPRPMATPEPAPAPPDSPELEGMDGWAGERTREIIRTFQAKGATSPETALSAEELGLPRMFVRIMRRRRGKTRVFVEVNGKYYLDQSALRGRK